MGTNAIVIRVVIALVIAVVLFFGYHIFNAYTAKAEPAPVPLPVPSPVQNYQEADNASEQQEYEPQPLPMEDEEEIQSDAISVVSLESEKPAKLPEVVGQTEEDLTTPEPLQQTPPPVKYDSPEASDPLNETVNMNANFGSNLRHPEQMIEKRPRRTMNNAIQSGVASKETVNYGRNEMQYSEEMIQNGGLMKDGLAAHEPLYVNGLGFSIL
jgi:hypothetical protein